MVGLKTKRSREIININSPKDILKKLFGSLLLVYLDSKEDFNNFIEFLRLNHIKVPDNLKDISDICLGFDCNCKIKLYYRQDGYGLPQGYTILQYSSISRTIQDYLNKYKSIRRDLESLKQELLYNLQRCLEILDDVKQYCSQIDGCLKCPFYHSSEYCLLEKLEFLENLFNK
jgi:hypothetical protein